MLSTKLASRGSPPLGDDTSAFDLGEAPRVRPGVHSLHLRADAAERSSYAAMPGVGREGKTVVAPAAFARIARSAAAPTALYLLAPRPPGADRPAARRIPLDAVLAPVALVGRSRLGGRFDGFEHAAILDRLIQLTARIPVYRLEMDRDVDRLDAAVDEIAGWHGRIPVATGAGVG
jgi:hypothetical protein